MELEIGVDNIKFLPTNGFSTSLYLKIILIGAILFFAGMGISFVSEIVGMALVMIGMPILMFSTVLFFTIRMNQRIFRGYSAKNTNSKSRFQIPKKIIIIGVVIGISLMIIGGIYSSTVEHIEVTYTDEYGNEGSYYTVKDEGDTMIILSLFIPGFFIIFGVTFVPMMSWSMRVGAKFWGFDSKKDKE